MRRGGGVGYDFSRIRPAGRLGAAARSRAPAGRSPTCACSTARCETVESAGSRRGAQMGVLRCDHPDIEEFIHAKDEGDLTNFNISVGVTDAFMQRGARPTPTSSWCTSAEPGADAIAAGAYQRDDGAVGLPQACARATLWDQIMRSTYDHAEPGVLFLDRINRDNNLSYCETHRGDQSLRRAAAAAVRLLLPRLDRPDALRARPVRGRARASTSRRFARDRRGRGAHARQRARRHRLAAAAAARGGDATSAASASASPAWATR